LEEQLEEIDTKYMEAKYENNILHIEMGKKELEPQIIVNPTRIMANGERR
jgi:HSP20 family molecular chaperone IbpA